MPGALASCGLVGRAPRAGRPGSKRRAARKCYGRVAAGGFLAVGAGRRSWSCPSCLPGLANVLRACGAVRILGAVIGEDFPAVLSAAQQGSEAAFTRLWADANPALVRYLRVIAPQAADDVAADTWVQVVRGLGRFRGDEAAWRAWLFTTARRRAIDASRRRARRREGPLHDVPEAVLPVTPDAADEALERLGTRSAVALLAGLPPLQAEVILLRVVAGLDNDAVARLVGRSPGAVRVAGHRGLRRLAEILAGTGVAR